SGSREVELRRGCRHHSGAGGDLRRLPHERAVLLERLAPAAALPGDGPSFLRSGPDPLDAHPCLRNGPLRHRLTTFCILPDDGLEDNKSEARLNIALDLARIQGKLARGLPERRGGRRTP